MSEEAFVVNAKTARRPPSGFPIAIRKFAHSGVLLQDNEGTTHLAERLGQWPSVRNPVPDNSFRQVRVEIVSDNPSRGTQDVLIEGKRWETQRRGKTPSQRVTVTKVSQFAASYAKENQYTLLGKNCHDMQESIRVFAFTEVPGRATREQPGAVKELGSDHETVLITNPSVSSFPMLSTAGRTLQISSELEARFREYTSSIPSEIPISFVPLSGSNYPDKTFYTNSFTVDMASDTRRTNHVCTQDTGDNEAGTPDKVIGGVVAGMVCGATASVVSGSAPIVVAAGYSSSAGFYVTATLAVSNPVVSVGILTCGAVGGVVSLACIAWGRYSQARRGSSEA